MTNQTQLYNILPIIAKAVNGEDLTAVETATAFKTVFLHDKNGYHFAVLMAAMHAKGETVDEFLGIINTFKDLSIKLSVKAPIDKIIDLSGTGGGAFKTINISTAASFVVAAVGFIVPKASYFGVTSPTGSADIFAHYGADIRKLSKLQIERLINQVGISPYYIPLISPRLKNRGHLFKKIFIDNQIRVQSPFHLTTNAFSPFPIKYRLYGCYSPKYLRRLAELFVKLGFTKSLTVYGSIDMPEISNVGPTVICLQHGNKISLDVFKPRDFGVNPSKPREIKTGGKDQNIQDFEAVLKGQATSAKSDLVAINAGAAFYLLGKTDNFKEGTHLAQKILKSGKAYDKLKQLKKFSNKF